MCLLSSSLAIGFNVEQVTCNNLKLQVWDLGGQTSIRPYWRCYYANTDAIIYVVDSCDRDRLAISKHELISMLEVRIFLTLQELIAPRSPALPLYTSPTSFAGSLTRYPTLPNVIVATLAIYCRYNLNCDLMYIFPCPCLSAASLNL